MIYTKEMARALRAIDKPLPFTLDVSDMGGTLALLVYESEIMSMKQLDRMLVMNYLNDVVRLFESFGRTTTIQGVPGEPRQL